MVLQAFHGGVDLWLVIALCGMVAGKAIARIYASERL